MAASFLVGATLLAGASAAVHILAPTQDINLPAGEHATNPLEWLGANGPWYAGPNVNGISSDVPKNCYVDQAAYVLRHGSRFPDLSAYQGWQSMQARISMENPTGAKEAYDLGYTLRTRYPDLYQDGDEFMVWANNYARVIQTAQMFVRGFLGWTASTNGSVISVTSTGFAAGIGDSLAPSDMCPLFADNGDASTQKATWDALWIPPVQERLQALIDGNLTLTSSDVSQIPYLCGFESHITGRLSPWCDVFTDEELKDYEYSNDLRYYYGTGPGTGLPSTMMTPYLNALVGLLAEGPAINGTDADGSSFAVPKLLMSFLNDGQLTELVTASGVFDAQAALSPTDRDDGRIWVGSRYVSMRGTIAFERLNCIVGGDGNSSNSTTFSRGLTSTSGEKVSASSTSAVFPTVTPTYAARLRRQAATKNETYIRIRLNDAVYPVPSCKDGPGSSCLLSDYVEYVAEKYAAQGDWITNCNVTTAGAPTTVKGASFYTDLTSPWLQRVGP